MKRLGVNIDHVATIRNARGTFHPDPLTIAKHVTKCGAHSVTIHLREDRRHIKGDLLLCEEDRLIIFIADKSAKKSIESLFVES